MTDAAIELSFIISSTVGRLAATASQTAFLFRAAAAAADSTTTTTTSSTHARAFGAAPAPDPRPRPLLLTYGVALLLTAGGLGLARPASRAEEVESPNQPTSL
ncbi:hypothetical protein F5X96DRAFT_675365 [Biscogniauxia mediterranea]|nr:hypothetical protein F5X96DRAFT_675365 [Biscogniauxia mediterranea]